MVDNPLGGLADSGPGRGSEAPSPSVTTTAFHSQENHRRRCGPLRPLRDDLVKPTLLGSAHATRTTRGCGSSTPAPRSSTRGSVHPRLLSTSRDSAISEVTDSPFMATKQPCEATNGIDHSSRRPSGATAREVTTSKVRTPCNESARPRTTSALDRPNSVTTSDRNVVRRSKGSTSTTMTSGRAMASTRPGRPAPEPMSHTDEPSGTTSPSTTELRR